MDKIFTFCLAMLCVINLNVSAQAVSSERSLDQVIYSKIDYNKLSDDVKQQINKNKLADVSLFEGIARAFVADVANVNSASDVGNQLSFLFSIPNVKEVRYIAENRIEIIASIDTEATLFKEVFLSYSVNANFIEQKFVVHQVK